MKSKKNPKVDLENKRSIFFLIGMAVTMMALIITVNWKTYEQRIMEFGDLDLFVDEEVVEQTVRQKRKPPPPPPPPEQISVVEEIVDLQEELIIESVEVDQDDEIEDVDFFGEETDEVLQFAVVENKPVFPGCENERSEADREACFQRMMSRHINNNFKFPEISRSMNSQGVIVVNFIIEKDGSISAVRVLRGVDEALDAEAIRVIKKLPKFEPAKQRGRPVRMSFNMPINARIQ
ncbi:MAG: energy transducer TonB [Flavobacteriales bacterium]|nr:MAG: energy transducer TonB [Flavobacteriales bacterium]